LFKQDKATWTARLITWAKQQKWKLLSKLKELSIDQFANKRINSSLFEALSNVIPIIYNKINIY